VAQRPSRIGTVSCGYADGYPRSAPSGTSVAIRGQRVPLAGRVSMDMLAVDLTDLPQAQLGDAVELWGAQLPIDELATACGTIGYELLTKVTGACRVATSAADRRSKFPFVRQAKAELCTRPS